MMGKNSKYGHYIEKYGDLLTKKYPTTNTKDLAIELNINLKVLLAVIAEMGLNKENNNKDVIRKRYPYEKTSNIAKDLDISESYVRTIASDMGIKKKLVRNQPKHIDVLKREDVIKERYPHENTYWLSRDLFIEEQHLRNIASNLNLKKSVKHIKYRDEQISKRYETDNRNDLAKELNISVSYLNTLIRKMKRKG